MENDSLSLMKNDILPINQEPQCSDGVLQLHNIYKESTLVEENPMLQRRKIALNKVVLILF